MAKQKSNGSTSATITAGYRLMAARIVAMLPPDRKEADRVLDCVEELYGGWIHYTPAPLDEAKGG